VLERISYRNSVRPSVFPYMLQPDTDFRSFLWQNYVTLDKGILLKGVKEGHPLQNRYFTAINSFSVWTVVDRHRLLLIISIIIADNISGSTDIDDLKWFKPPKLDVLVIFLLLRV